MFIKGFVLIFLFFIPFVIFSTRKQKFATPKIFYFSPTPSHIIITPSVDQAGMTNQPSQYPIPTSFSVSPTTMQLNDFIYPNSEIHVRNNSSVFLTSTDDPAIITTWYKDKINEMSINTTSLITTNSNNNISNKITASKGQQQIQIEITKSANDSQVFIKVMQ